MIFLLNIIKEEQWLASKNNEGTEIVIDNFLDYLKSSNLSNEAWIRKERMNS